jgi:hypothetical protein
MAIENLNQIQAVEADIFGDYQLNGVSPYADSNKDAGKNKFQLKSDVTTYAAGTDQYYSIPLKAVKDQAKNTCDDLLLFVDELEKLLNEINLDPNATPAISEYHRYVWSEISKINDQSLGEGTLPNFISHAEYIYAEKHGCRGCRKFMKEYDQLISSTTFGHIYSFRKIAKALIHEAECIKKSLITDFGDDYEDESQQQVATYYLYWLKMATHYQRRFEDAIPASPVLLPESEVDKVTKRQAGQFQAFFSIRVNSETVSINNQIESLNKDLGQDCGVFYEKFLGPSIKFKTKVGGDLALDFRTTNMLSQMPRLAEEAITAVLTIEGNFKSILTDLLERRNIMIKKVDSLYQSIMERRKYVLYISQLASKAISKNRIVTSESNEEYISAAYYAVSDRSYITESLKSSHSSLDDLGEDSHPQYLLKTGGTISGDVLVEPNVTIDGIDLSTHSHTGHDGSTKIRSIDIDYNSVRDDYKNSDLLKVKDILDIKIESFIPDILIGGVPVADVVVSINVPDDLKDKYEFEIRYIEI